MKSQLILSRKQALLSFEESVIPVRRYFDYSGTKSFFNTETSIQYQHRFHNRPGYTVCEVSIVCKKRGDSI